MRNRLLSMLLLAAPAIASVPGLEAAADTNARVLTLRCTGERPEWLVDGARVAGPERAAPAPVVRGAGDQDDRLIVDFSSGLCLPEGLEFDGGAGGYDVLEVRGGHFRKVTFNESGPDSGSIRYETGTTPAFEIRFLNLEPVVNDGTAEDIVFNLTGVADVAQLTDASEPNDPKTKLSSSGTFEETVFTNPTGSLTVNGGEGDDLLFVNSLASGFASLNLHGGGDLDQVILNADITFAEDASLDVGARFIVVNGDLTASGSGGVDLSGEAQVVLSDVVVQAADGPIRIHANAAEVAVPGNFRAIDILASQIKTTGTGSIDLLGIGGADESTGSHYGVYIAGQGSVISSTSTGDDAGGIDIEGRAGSGVDNNLGIYMQSKSSVSSVKGPISIRGFGGMGSGSGNGGVFIDGSVVKSTMSGSGAATVTIEGTGGSGTQNTFGVWVFGQDSAIQTISGDLKVTGTGGAGTDQASYGVHLLNDAQIQSLGVNAPVGSVTIEGTGGDSPNGLNIGVLLESLGTSVSTINGALQITGHGGDGGQSNHGVQMAGQASVLSSGTGASAGTVSITGTAGDGTSGCMGVRVGSATSRISSADGAVVVTGTGAGTGPGGNGVDVVAGGAISISGTAPLTLTGTGSQAMNAEGDGVRLLEDHVSVPGTGTVTVNGNALDGQIEIEWDSLTLHKTTGAYIFNGAVDSGTLAVDAGAYSVALAQGGLLQNSVTFSNTGGVQIGGAAADFTTAMGSLTSTASTTTLGGTVQSSSGAFTFGAVTLAAATMLGSAGGVTISSIAGGGQDLTVSSAMGTAAFTVNGDVTNLGDGTGAALTVQSVSGAVHFKGAIAGNSGIDCQSVGTPLLLDQNVILGNGDTGTHLACGTLLDGLVLTGYDGIDIDAASLTGGAVSITGSGSGGVTIGSVDGEQNLSVVTGGTVTFDGAVLLGNTGGVSALGGSMFVTGAVGTSGSGTIDLTVFRDFTVSSGGSIAATTGTIHVMANQGVASITGDFSGITLDGGTITSSGAATITLEGRGGDDPGTFGHHGVNLTGTGSAVRSTSSAANAGTISITGRGGIGSSFSSGFNAQTTVQDGTVEMTSKTGDIQIHGTGGAGTGDHNKGVFLGFGARVLSSGTGVASAASITLDGTGGSGDSSACGVELLGGLVSSVAGDIILSGTGGPAITSFNRGVFIAEGATLTSATGGIDVTGVGSATGDNGIGVQMLASTIRSTGTAAANGITIAGTGGPGNSGTGVEVSQNALITTVTGPIEVTATGGPTGIANFGMNLGGGAKITSTGTGSSAAPISITATGGSGQAGYGFFETNSDTQVASVDGDVEITGTASSDSSGAIRIDSATRVVVTGAGDLTLVGTMSSGAQGVAVALYPLSVLAPGAGAVLIRGSNESAFDEIQLPGQFLLQKSGGSYKFEGFVDAQSSVTAGTGAYSVIFDDGVEVDGAASFSNSGELRLGHLATDGSTFFNGLTATSPTTSLAGPLYVLGAPATLGALKLRADASVTTDSVAVTVASIDAQSHDLTFDTVGNPGNNLDVTVNGNVTNLGDGDGPALTFGFADGGLVKFLGTVTGNSGIVSLDEQPTVRFTGDVTLADGNFHTDISCPLELDGLTYFGYDGLLFSKITLSGGPVTLTARSGDIGFFDALDGAQNLTLNSSGVTTFRRAAGLVTPLKSVTTDAGGSTRIRAAVSTNGPQTFGDVVNQFQAPVSSGGSNVLFSDNVTVTDPNAAVSSGAGVIHFVKALDIPTGLNLSLSSTSSALLGSSTTLEGGAITVPGGVTVPAAGSLEATGTITGPVTVLSGGKLEPGLDTPGVLSVGSLDLRAGATVAFDLTGPTSAQQDRIVSTGAVSLGGSTLSATLGFTPSETTLIRLIVPQNATPTSGTFAGLPEGATFSGGPLKVSYRFGSKHNNVVLKGDALVPGAWPPAVAASVLLTWLWVSRRRISSKTKGRQFLSASRA